ncbi:MAG: dTMP kinase [Pseudomonadota bacterium]
MTFEGGEGAGKSTQIKELANRIKGRGLEVVLTREPGGSDGAEILRHVLLSGAAEPFGSDFEVVLFAAARLDHMQQKIIPALQKGAVVLCDRFYDSTRAYQGGEGGVSAAFLSDLEILSVGKYQPDLTFILDIPPRVGLERVRARSGSEATPIDRFEKDDLVVHHDRRRAFLDIAAREPNRCVVIDATKPADLVAYEIWGRVSSLIDRNDRRSELANGESKASHRGEHRG